MELVNVIATNIQNLLDERNISVAEISSILGVSRQTMTNYLKAASVIDSVQLAKIADFFGIPIIDLYSNPINKKSEMIFRTALNYSTALDEIQDKIYSYIEEYSQLVQNSKKQLCYFPEQHNLTLNLQGHLMDINYECQNYFDPKLKIDNALDTDILRIANEQRLLLGLGDKGAISLIPALTHRGINVIFIDLGSNDIFGLSLCDDTKGCFIFVNSNSTISVERQLFTLAHEYGHIVMHRPIFKRKLQPNLSCASANLLDKMADRFAGYLLEPEQLLAPYASYLQPIKNDLNAIYRFLIPLKLKLQVSLQSLLISLKNLGYISPSVVNEYFKFIERRKSNKEEPSPISHNTELFRSFKHECSSNITEMVHSLYVRGLFNTDECRTKLQTFGTQSSEEINALLTNWESANSFDFNIKTSNDNV